MCKKASCGPGWDHKDCMLCGKSTETNAHSLDSLPYKVLECFRKKEHTRAFEIQDRLHGCIDLAAAEAVYHDSCFPGSISN